jgi:hypothetical protein
VERPQAQPLAAQPRTNDVDGDEPRRTLARRGTGNPDHPDPHHSHDPLDKDHLHNAAERAGRATMPLTER